MSEDAKKTEGGVWIRVGTDKRKTDHIDIYDENPRDEHDESMHIKIREDGRG